MKFTHTRQSSRCRQSRQPLAALSYLLPRGTRVSGGIRASVRGAGACKNQIAQRGFTLLEVLVAIVVLSIGLLGLAGLQAAGLRNNTSAYMRTIATQQVHDMADRMRANLPGVITNAYNAIAGIPADPACISAATGCSIANLAIYDAFAWNTRNQNLLPLGTGTVTRVVGAPAGVNRFIISVGWDDNRTGAINTTFTTTIDL